MAERFVPRVTSAAHLVELLQQYPGDSLGGMPGSLSGSVMAEWALGPGAMGLPTITDDGASVARRVVGMRGHPQGIVYALTLLDGSGAETSSAWEARPESPRGGSAGDVGDTRIAELEAKGRAPKRTGMMILVVVGIAAAVLFGGSK